MLFLAPKNKKKTKFGQPLIVIIISGVFRISEKGLISLPSFLVPLYPSS